MTTGATQSAEPSQPAADTRAYRDVQSAWVVSVALVSLVVIVAIVILSLPTAQKGQNIIAIAAASFGVIGAIVGAYFGVSSSNRAAEIIRSTGGSSDGTSQSPQSGVAS